TRKVTVDILEDATGAPLQGGLVYLAHPMEGEVLIALGTVTEIRTSNRWHEDPNMRGVLKHHGNLPHLSGVGDVRTGEVLIQAAYVAESRNPSEGAAPIESGGALSMSPTTGASVSKVTDEFLTQLLRRHRDQITYLGQIYRSEVRMPVTIRHFGRSDQGGTGEAYHTGIFGMTGSGKSGLAAYLVAAQLRHPQIGVLVIDPQGQFTGEEGLPFSLQEWAEHEGRQVTTYSISADLRLQKDAYLLGDLLGLTRFFKDFLTIKGGENRESAVAEVTRILQGTPQWEDQAGDQVLRAVLTTLVADQQALTRIYSSQQGRDRLTAAIQTMLGDAGQFQLAAQQFNPLHSLFTATNIQGGPRHSIYQVLGGVLDPKIQPRPLVIIDFSSAGQQGAGQILESTEVKARILQVVCSMLSVRAEQLYHQGTGLNVLVVFDEAHRFAAEEPENDEALQLSNRLVDYVRTTRKYGLGWMFITQEISSLRRGIYTQLRVRCFGYGLTSGSELQRLREAVGDPSTLELYRSFVDPGAIQPKQFPFMISGPISPLSFTGAPLFLSVYTDFGQFKADNGIKG
ncbi:MAG: ATP-binding protein, partial [Gammaproteobacteria bacterium]